MASVPISILLYNGPLLCGFTVTIKGSAEGEVIVVSGDLVTGCRVADCVNVKEDFNDARLCLNTCRKPLEDCYLQLHVLRPRNTNANFTAV